MGNNNARRQAPIALKQIWTSAFQSNHVFAFLIAISEVNTNYGETEFEEEEVPKPMLQFHRELSHDLIYNLYIIISIQSDGIRKSQRNLNDSVHILLTLPKEIFSENLYCGSRVRLSL